MRTSIVVPAYNAERYLCQTLDSVLAQSLPGWELIIVDDGSTDGTARIAREYAGMEGRIRLVQQANGGVSAARNTGLAAADSASDYVAFLDADDVWERDTLETLVKTIEAHPQAPVAHGVARYVDGSGRPCQQGEAERWTRLRRGIVGRRLVSWPLDQPTTFAVMVYRNCILTPGQAITRRSALEAAGNFDLQVCPSEDWDMWLRLARLGDFAFVDRVVLNYRQHDSNATRAKSLMGDAIFQVQRKLATAQESSEEQRRLAAFGYRYYQRYLCLVRLQWASGCLRRGQLLQAARQMLHAVRSYAGFLHASPFDVEADKRT